MDLQTIKVWVLAPFLETDDPNLAYFSDYTQSQAEYQKAFDDLQIAWQWQPVTIDNFKQIVDKIAAKAMTDATADLTPVVFNLCDGDDTNGIPGISVIHYLEEKKLIYTGSDAAFYDITTSKILGTLLASASMISHAGFGTFAWSKACFIGIFEVVMS